MTVQLTNNHDEAMAQWQAKLDQSWKRLKWGLVTAFIYIWTALPLIQLMPKDNLFALPAFVTMVMLGVGIMACCIKYHVDYSVTKEYPPR